MIPRVVLPALLAVLAALPARAADAPAAVWKIGIIQIDKAGTMVGDPHDMTCPNDGCEQVMQFDIDGKPQRLLAVLTFVQRGAYVALKPTTSDIRKVIEFSKGYDGPIFLPLRGAERVTKTLSFVLTGSAMTQSDTDSAQLMQNSGSLVFHRKLEPDLTLTLDFTPPPSAPAG